MSTTNIQEAKWLLGDDPAEMVHWITGPLAQWNRGPDGKPLLGLEVCRLWPSDRQLRLFVSAVGRLPGGLPYHKRAAYLAALDRVEAAAEGGPPVGREQPGYDGYCVESADASSAARFVCGTGRDSRQVAGLLREVIGNPWRPVRAFCPSCRGRKKILVAILDGPRRPAEYFRVEPDRPVRPLDYRKEERDCPRCEGTGRVRGIEAAWKTPTVLSIAQECYDGRRWEELPILADALEDAGCDHPALLGHLRGEKIPGVPLDGPHCLGCWALDAVLGKG